MNCLLILDHYPNQIAFNVNSLQLTKGIMQRKAGNTCMLYVLVNVRSSLKLEGNIVPYLRWKVRSSLHAQAELYQVIHLRMNSDMDYLVSTNCVRKVGVEK